MKESIVDIKILTKLLELSDVFLLNIQKLSNKKNYKEQEKKNIRLFRDLMKIAIPPSIITNILKVNKTKIRKKDTINTKRKSRKGVIK